MINKQLGSEYPPADEQELIAEVVENMTRQYLSDHPPGTKPNTRGLHAKAHGCVDIKFEVADNLPPELKAGLFAQPKTYSGWLRFSNGSPKIQPDIKGDVRGMAIKLRDVPGQKVLENERDATTHDLILGNHDVFFVRNAADYVAFTGALSRADLPALIGFLFGWNPLRWRLTEIKNLVMPMLQKVPNLLGIPYYSQTPYRLGQNAVKYAAIPTLSNMGNLPSNPSPNYLREVMAAHLSRSEASFDFMVQLQTCADKMPVEDPTVSWSEQLSPWRKVATIRIPAQAFDTPERDALLENMSFTPWHCLPENQPIGGVNRTRKAVYETISKLRRERNGVPQTEP